jgi:hypothetical protein
MHIKLLTEEEYLETMSEQMVDATEFAEAVVDIWTYVKTLVADGVVKQHVYDNALIEMVYRNEEEFFDHILLPADDENIFIVIVVDFEHAELYGHYILNLKEEYGI